MFIFCCFVVLFEFLLLLQVKLVSTLYDFVGPGLYGGGVETADAEGEVGRGADVASGLGIPCR